MIAMLLPLWVMTAISILAFIINVINCVEQKKSVGHRLVDLLGSVVMIVFVVYLYYMMGWL